MAVAPRLLVAILIAVDVLAVISIAAVTIGRSLLTVSPVPALVPSR
ncbi:MAG: hypothetical protein WB507_10820 [Solirubrobacterales bacterium]